MPASRHLLLALMVCLTAQASAAEPARPTQSEIDRLVKQLVLQL
jgi:hypothetical protein